jgi:hypothetical protein
MLNLFAYRATDPQEILKQEFPIGDQTDRYILEGAYRSKEIVCCWGRHGAHLDRGAYIKELLHPNFAEKMRYLRMLDGGVPGHPLYLPNSSKRQVWFPKTSAN